MEYRIIESYHPASTLYLVPSPLDIIQIGYPSIYYIGKPLELALGFKLDDKTL